MAKNKTRIKAKAKKGIVTVKAMAKHPMLSHLEAKKAKKTANWITHIVAESNGKVVYEVSTSQFISGNPYLKFQYKGEKGEKLVIKWVDMAGNTNESTGKVK
jgi:sulfur-oxidizing protein SoxZ